MKYFELFENLTHTKNTKLKYKIKDLEKSHRVRLFL
jgi:hypothetical protein